MLKKLLLFIGLLTSTFGYSQSLKYDTIVPINDNIAIGDISDVIELGSNYVLRFQKNKAVTEKASQPKSSIPTSQISYVVWDGVRIEGNLLKPTRAKKASAVNNTTRGNLLPDNGNKKIKAGGILMVLGGTFLTSGLILSTQPVDSRIATSLMIVGGINVTFGGGFIAAGAARNEKARRAKIK